MRTLSRVSGWKKTCATVVLAGLMAVAVLPASARTKERDPFFQQVNAQSVALAEDAVKKGLSREPLLVTSTQNLDQLPQSGRVGRLVGDLVSSSLSSLGFSVYEVRLGTDLHVTTEGEHLLTKNWRDIQQEYHVNYAVVSTYSKSFSKMYVTLKIIRLADGMVVASRSFVTSAPM